MQSAHITGSGIPGRAQGSCGCRIVRRAQGSCGCWHSWKMRKENSAGKKFIIMCCTSCTVTIMHALRQWRRPGAEFGGRTFFFADQDFWMRYFRKKFPFLRPKFLKTFFLVIDQFSDFPYLYRVKCRIWPFLHKKKHYFRKEFLDDTFFTLFVLLRASDNTTSQNIGGNGCMGRPPPQILGGPSPSPP